MAKFDVVLFDLDGTIIDSIELILESHRQTFTTFGKTPLSREELIAEIGKPLDAQYGAWADDADEAARMVAAYIEYNLSIHDRHVRVYDGMPEVLEALRAAEVPLAIVTSKRRAATRKGLGLFDLERHFETLVTPEDVTRGKPDPEPVRLALSRLGGIDPSRAVFIGDSPHDMNAGHAAGVSTAAARWGPFTREALAESSPHAWLAHPRDVLALVDP